MDLPASRRGMWFPDDVPRHSNRKQETPLRPDLPQSRIVTTKTRPLHSFTISTLLKFEIKMFKLLLAALAAPLLALAAPVEIQKRTPGRATYYAVGL